MDSESKSAGNVLAAIAESNARFLEFANMLRSSHGVIKVAHDFECRRTTNYSEFGTGPRYLFDWYVDVELRNHVSVWWAMDVSWDEEYWIISSRVEMPGESRPKALNEIPDRHAGTINQFVSYLEAATSELLDSADTVLASVAEMSNS